MKTRAKAEINLIIPKLKSQLLANLERSQTEAVNRIKQQASSYVQKLKQDFQMERQVLIEHLRRKQYEEISKIKNQLQLKFEAKLIEEKKKYMANGGGRGYNTHNSYNNGFGNSHNTQNSYGNVHNPQNGYGNSHDTPWKASNSKQFSSIFNEEPSFLL